MSKKGNDAGSALSERFEILSHAYRRRVLMTLAHDNPQDEDDIATEAVADDHDPSDEVPDHVQLQLHHTHLPKLADAGFIDWDRDTGTITRGPRFEEIEPLLRLMHDHQDELPDDWP